MLRLFPVAGCKKLLLFLCIEISAHFRIWQNEAKNLTAALLNFKNYFPQIKSSKQGKEARLRRSSLVSET
jgi:hypothetical protein